MKKIAIVGSYGKMGQLLIESLSKEYQIVGIDKNDEMQLAKDSDLVIDFSTGENSAKTAIWCEKNQKSLIIGATGQTNEENDIILHASKNIPLMKAGNFSIGISAIKQMLKNIPSIKIDNIAIFEKHHKNKKDTPSGTAIELEGCVSELFNKNPQVVAIRGGEEIGLHEISLYFGSEVITISHQAFSRKAFVDGVVIAAKFMLEKTQNGFYTFENLMKNWIKFQILFVGMNKNM